MDILREIAERKILEAIEEGMFDDLPGAGKPVEVEDLSCIPEHLRMVYIILKNAKILPEEVRLRKDVASLKNLINACFDEEERRELQKKLTETELRYNLLMERNLREKLRMRG